MGLYLRGHLLFIYECDYCIATIGDVKNKLQLFLPLVNTLSYHHIQFPLKQYAVHAKYIHGMMGTIVVRLRHIRKPFEYIYVYENIRIRSSINDLPSAPGKLRAIILPVVEFINQEARETINTMGVMMVRIAINYPRFCRIEYMRHQ